AYTQGGHIEEGLAALAEAFVRAEKTSADLTNLLCKRCEVLTPVVGADTFDYFLCRQETCWFQNRPLAMHPPRFNGVEPGTLAGQWTDDQATATFALDTLVVGFEPLPYHFTAMPGGIIPDQQQRLLAMMDHAISDPGQIVAGHLADRPPVDKAQQHRIRLGQEEPVARESLAVQVCCGRLFFHEAQGLVLRPGVQRRLSQAAPPDFILEAQRPGGLPHGQADQSVATIFFRT